MVILAADDPGMYSSQNEQDSHYYAQRGARPHARSRPTRTRRCASRARPTSFPSASTCRSSCARRCASRTPRPPWSRGRARRPRIVPYETNPAKWVMMPAFAKPRRKVQLEAYRGAEARGPRTVPTTGWSDAGVAVGVVCAGSAYQHVVEALPDASVFKLGCTWPLPARAPARLRGVGGRALRGRRGLRVPGRGRAARWASKCRRSRPGCRATANSRPGWCAPRSAWRRPPTREALGRPASPPAGAVPRLPAPAGVQGAAPASRPSSRATSAATRSARCRRFRPWTRAWTWARRSRWHTASSWRSPAPSTAPWWRSSATRRSPTRG